MPLPIIVLNPLVHNNTDCVGLKFPYAQLIEEVKKIPGVRYSKTHTCWYVPNDGKIAGQIFTLFKGKAFVDYSALGSSNKATPKKENQKAVVPVEPKVNPEHQQALRMMDQKLKLKGYSENTKRTYLQQFKEFLKFYFESNPIDLSDIEIRNYLLYLIEHRRISRRNLEKTKLAVPTLSEQTQIGNFFKNLDNLITLHQQKYDKLRVLKKAMLEKMFPKNGADVPEIRFKGFSGAWEEKKYSETFINISNNTLSRADLNYNSGLAKNIHYGDVLIKFGELLDIEKAVIPYISDSVLANKLNTSKLQNGDVIIADAAEDETVGKCTEIVNIGEEAILSGLHTIPIRPIFSFASGYLGYFMNSSSYHTQLLRLMQGTKVLSISKSAIQNTFIFFPNDITEQEKIGNYFKNLDSLLTLHQGELGKLKNLKKAMLEKMFV